MAKITFTPEARDFLSAMRMANLVRRRSTKPLLLALIGPTLGAIAGFMIAARSGSNIPHFWAAVFFAVVYLSVVLCEFVWVEFTARSAARAPLSQREQTFEWRSDGFSIASAQSHADILWSEILGYFITSNVAAFYIQKHIFIIIPVRSMSSDQVRELADTVAKAGVPNWRKWH